MKGVHAHHDVAHCSHVVAMHSLVRAAVKSKLVVNRTEAPRREASSAKLCLLPLGCWNGRARWLTLRTSPSLMVCGAWSIPLPYQLAPEVGVVRAPAMSRSFGEDCMHAWCASMHTHTHIQTNKGNRGGLFDSSTHVRAYTHTHTHTNRGNSSWPSFRRRTRARSRRLGQGRRSVRSTHVFRAENKSWRTSWKSFSALRCRSFRNPARSC